MPHAEGLQGAGAAGDLRAQRRQRPAHDADQPAQAALRQPGAAARDGAGARPQGVHRHHQRRARTPSAPTCCRAPNGVWGMPPDVLQTLPGYDPDVAKNRAEARKIMEKLGYGPDNRLAIKVSTRNFPAWRDPAVILISQLKGDLHRRRTRTGRHRRFGIAKMPTQGLHRRRGADRERRR